MRVKPSIGEGFKWTSSLKGCSKFTYSPAPGLCQSMELYTGQPGDFEQVLIQRDTSEVIRSYFGTFPITLSDRYPAVHSLEWDRE